MRPTDKKTGRFIAAGTIASDEEMDAQNERVLANSMIYSKEIGSGEKIGLIVSSIADDIANVGEKIEFRNTALVKETTMRYLRSCSRVGAIPSKIGLARACGCSRKAFDKFIQRNPEHPTSEFLQIVIDGFAEANMEAGQSGSCHPIFAMFVLKAMYGLRENDPLPQLADNPLGEITDTTTLMKKYEEIGE